MIKMITCLLNKINLSKMNRYKHEKLTKILTITLLVLILLSVLTISFMHFTYAADDEISSQAITDLTNTSWFIYSGFTVANTYDCLVTGTLIYNGKSVILPLSTHMIFSSRFNYIEFSGGSFDEPIYINGNTEFAITFTSFDPPAGTTQTEFITFFETYGIQLKVTDLTDTTWNIPAGWEAEAGYGEFNVECSTNDYSHTTLSIGQIPMGGGDELNVVVFSSGFGEPTEEFTPNDAYAISFLGGVDVTNPKLIAWLSKYGQLQGSEEPEPELGTFTVYYGLDDPRNYELSFVLGMTFGEWVENTTYNSIGAIVVSGYDKYDGELYTCISLGENIDVPEVSYGTNYYVFGLPKGGGFVKPDTVIVDGSNYSVDTATLYDESFANGYSEGWNTGYDRGESAGELRGYNNGFSDGKIEGIEEGYAQGYSKGESDSFVHGFFGNFLSGVVQAIDSIHFYEYTIDDMGTPETNDDEVFYISPWSIFIVFIGLAFVIIFLKVFRGG